MWMGCQQRGLQSVSNLNPKDMSYDMAINTFAYNSISGEFLWLPRDRTGFNSEGSFKRWNYLYAGRPAFTNINPHGYAHTKVWGVRYLAHRVAWVIHYGVGADLWIDHINGNRADNRIYNLREVTPAQNGFNRAENKNNKCGLKGVTFHPRNSKWQARIRVGDKKVSLGYFHTKEDAHDAYIRAAMEFHGDYWRASKDV